jgi:hypothetical protein
MTVTKRQREQKQRERQQMKAERRAQRKDRINNPTEESIETTEPVAEQEQQ